MKHSLPRTLARQPKLILSHDISIAKKHIPEGIFPVSFGDPLVHINQGIGDVLVGHCDLTPI